MKTQETTYFQQNKVKQRHIIYYVKIYKVHKMLDKTMSYEL